MPTAQSAGHMRAGDAQVRPTWPRLVIANLILTIAYAALGGLALLLVRETGVSAPVWPSAGLAVAAVFLRGPWMLPGVVAGSFLANLPNALADPSTMSAVSLAFGLALAGAAGAYAGATLARRAVGPRPMLTHAGEILRFLGLAALLGAAVSASLGTAIQFAAGVAPMSVIGLVWLTWWVGDALGILVVLPLGLMIAPEQAAAWKGRRWQVAVPSLLVLAAVTFAVVQNAGLVLEQRAQAFAQQASDAAATLQREAELHVELLNGVVSREYSAPFTTAEAFRAYTASFLARHPDIQAVSWNPIVPDDARARFIASQRDAASLPDYRITERDAAGQLIPATNRAEYVPVAFIEPLAANAPALGFDVASEPTRAEAIARARETRSPQLTAPVRLVQESGSQAGALMFVPEIGAAGEVEGFGVGVWRLGDLLSGILDQGRWRDWNFELRDVTPGTAPQVIATSRVEAGSIAPPADRVSTQPIAIGGRLWTLSAWPSASALAAQPPATSPYLLLGSLLIVFLLESFLLLVTGLERRARNEAETSTFDALHDELTGLLNRRGFFRAFEALRNRTASDGTTSILIYLDLDGFKAVNDEAGHDVGDDLLRQVGANISTVLRERDVVARLGGDEFAVIAVNCSLDRGTAIAESIEGAVKGTIIHHDSRDYRSTASVGLTLIEGPDVPELDDLMRTADSACYEAKRAGGGDIRVAAAT